MDCHLLLLLPYKQMDPHTLLESRQASDGFIVSGNARPPIDLAPSARWGDSGPGNMVVEDDKFKGVAKEMNNQ